MGWFNGRSVEAKGKNKHMRKKGGGMVAASRVGVKPKGGQTAIQLRPSLVVQENKEIPHLWEQYQRRGIV